MCRAALRLRVSIHAPHEGERRLAHICRRHPQIVSIHAPHEGERLSTPAARISIILPFQSTLPTRGSDYLRPRAKTSNTCFNPRSPRGGATLAGLKDFKEDACFNPRSPRGGATCSTKAQRCFCGCFNPRSPRGGATAYRFAQNAAKNMFQSTLPTRGSDKTKVPAFLPISVSIHAPHEGERRRRALIRCGVVGFQSTLPTRGSDVRDRIQREKMEYVSIHAPHEGERLTPYQPAPPVDMFQSTLPTRGSDTPKSETKQ